MVETDRDRGAGASDELCAGRDGHLSGKLKQRNHVLRTVHNAKSTHTGIQKSTYLDIIACVARRSKSNPPAPLAEPWALSAGTDMFGVVRCAQRRPETGQRPGRL
jgi:hypothetical protein